MTSLSLCKLEALMTTCVCYFSHPCIHFVHIVSSFHLLSHPSLVCCLSFRCKMQMTFLSLENGPRGERKNRFVSALPKPRETNDCLSLSPICKASVLLFSFLCDWFSQSRKCRSQIIMFSFSLSVDRCFISDDDDLCLCMCIFVCVCLTPLSGSCVSYLQVSADSCLRQFFDLTDCRLEKGNKEKTRKGFLSWESNLYLRSS